MKNHLLRIKPGMSLFACAVCALGLLLWARLLLVSHPPRVATAEPSPAAVVKAQPVRPDVKEKDDKRGDRSDGAKELKGQGESGRGE